MFSTVPAYKRITPSRSLPNLGGLISQNHPPPPPMADSRQTSTAAKSTPFTSGPSSHGASNASFTSIDEPSQFLFTPDVNTSSSQHELTSPSTPPPALVVFSGGTAFNSVASHVRHLTTRVAHILPVSDDGGSTAEIVRVLGGPAVGDIRSRCLRLADDSDKEAQAVRHLLAYRLSSRSPEEAKREWYEIVEGNHKLWEGVSDPYKHTIRAFLVHFHANILRHSTERFNFRSGSVGNFFFAGARTFFRSLEAAIFLFSRVARIPEGSLVLPAICTEERITLAAELADGSVLVGQNEISHPALCTSPLAVDKHKWEAFPSPVRRIFYLSAEGDRQEHEVAPSPNPRLLSELRSADAVIYGIGSLYTSVCPSLILRGVGEAVASRTCPKILILNGGTDRETSSCQAHSGPMTASDVVLAITDALNRRGASSKSGRLGNEASAYVSAVIVPRGGSILVDDSALVELGVGTVVQVTAVETADGSALYDPDALVDAIANIVLGDMGSLAAATPKSGAGKTM